MNTLSFDSKRGLMKLIPNDRDDLWVLYNVVSGGDRVYGRTSRVIKTLEETARPTKGKRVSLFLGIRVENTAFSRFNDRLRIHGVVIHAPEKYALKGRYHNIIADVGKPLTIVKDEWFRRDLDMIERAGKWKTTPILIVAMDDEESGIAVMRQNTLQIKAEVEASLPSKREADQRGEAAKRYFQEASKALFLEWDKTRGPVAIVGPGFLKNSFVRYLQRNNPKLADSISVVGLANSGGVGGVQEALRSGVLYKLTKKVRIMEETRAVKEVLRRLGAGDGNVAYGLEAVDKAVIYGAVELLLISTKLLRESVCEERRNMEALMRRAEKMGGRVMIVGSEHEAGAELLGLGGIAAQLRFNIDPTA